MTENSRKKNQNVTIFDVARVAGVSYSTVSRVLNGFAFVKEETRQRVLESAERLGYVANLQARSLAGGHSQVIGLLVPGLDNDYIGQVARGIDEELAKVNYDLMLYTTHRHLARESSYVSAISSGLTDGLLLVVPLLPTKYLTALQEKNFPYVLIDQFDESGKSAIVDSANWQGAYNATDYLIELGHTRIGFITGQMALRSAVDRLAGYKAALLDHHLPILDDLIIEGDFWQTSGHTAMKKLLGLSEIPTAVFASNDLSAFGAMDAVRESGLRIPEDISILGFDDIPQASVTHPKLTTVRQPLAQMGKAGVQLLLEKIKDPTLLPQRITLDTELIIRDSCIPVDRH